MLRHDKPGAVQVLQWIHGVAAQLAEVPAAEIALQLYLQAAHAASEVARLELIAYEFFEQVCHITPTHSVVCDPELQPPSTAIASLCVLYLGVAAQSHSAIQVKIGVTTARLKLDPKRSINLSP